jgi:ABC-type bacteriocin/lantibiotic exporter with double-glycine peptidase domain
MPQKHVPKGVSVRVRPWRQIGFVMLKVLKFSIRGQWYDFDCGVTVAWSILKYLKIKVTYESILKASKVCPVDGLKPIKLVNLLEKFGLSVVCENNKNIRFLKKQITNDKPVIVLIQARKEYKKSWSNTWIHGHYVVVIGFDKNRLFIYDPSMGGSVKIFTHKQFYNRWHDYLNNNDYIRTAIYIN